MFTLTAALVMFVFKIEKFLIIIFEFESRTNLFYIRDVVWGK